MAQIWSRGPALLNQHLFKVLPKADTDVRFLHQLLNYKVEALLGLAHGTTMKHIKRSDLLPFPLICARPPEQQRIAEILDTLDEAIRKTEGVIAKLRQMKQGLLHDLLTRGLDDNGELRDSDRHPEQFHMTALGCLPKVWEIAPFKRFETPARPFLKTGPFGSSLKGEHWAFDGVPVITIGALGEGEFIASELLFVSERTSKRLSAYVVRPGDIVFSRVADVGRSVVVKEHESGWIISSNLMWISLDQAAVAPEYVWLNLSGNPRIRSQVRRFVNAGGREVANGGILQSMRLAWPQFPEQQEVVTRARALDQRRQSEEVALAKLLALKGGLMDDLLTGRVRVTNLIEKAA